MKQPAWDLDLGYGQAGEDLVRGWHRGHHEVKRKRRSDLYFYIETHQNPWGSGWKPSGLNVTEAGWWEFVIADTGVVVAIPTDRLRAALVSGIGVDRQETDGECPTRGRLMSLYDLLNKVPV